MSEVKNPLIPKKKLTREKAEVEKQEKLKALPADFAQRVASKVESIVELERDEEKLSRQLAELFYQNLNEPYLVDHFFDVIHLLIQEDEKRHFAAMIYVALHYHEDEPECSRFNKLLVKHMVFDNREDNREPFIEEKKNRKFSSYAADLSECFIQMMAMNSDLYDVITKLYTNTITVEMEDDLKEEEKSSNVFLRIKNKKDKSVNKTQKKLYDDIIDYVAYRSEFSSNSLNQQNPNEFIIVLADRMRSTRRYVIQEIMNKHVMGKKKQLEKELKEREANAEEIIRVTKPFAHALFLFWVEKRYNYHYLAVDKVRVSLQILSILLGILIFIMSFLGLNTLSMLESALVAVLMYSFSRLAFSRPYFKAYYPKDVTNELEQEVGVYTPIFRKMSKTQLKSFLLRQIKLPDNQQIIQFIPEFMRYVYAIVTDHSNFLITREELSEVVESIEIEIARQKRNSLKTAP